MTSWIEDAEAFGRGQREYWRQVSESEYITLTASDPTTGSVLTFQEKVEENLLNRLNVIISLVRPKGSSSNIPLRDDREADRLLHELHGNDGLSLWPSEAAFYDTRRFYIAEESELLGIDWIRLYLELVLCSKDRLLTASKLSKLMIVKVAVETSNEDVEPLNARLNAKSAVFYITFRLAIWGLQRMLNAEP
ncbi:hypothetical protein CARUB_v10024904mg [Capsella rubella]|uniref:Uncharacterized protein n=1 Tax=Capsella rubella TaxID=81985 RepID=R0HG76_9BRAS|nr:hypothetical protein CARUB_v10024904mg [Capsella rubella]